MTTTGGDEIDLEDRLVARVKESLAEEMERRAMAAGLAAQQGSVMMPGMVAGPPSMSAQHLRHTALMLALQQAGGADSAKVVEAAGRYLRFLQGSDAGGLTAVDSLGRVHQFPAPGE